MTDQELAQRMEAKGRNRLEDLVNRYGQPGYKYYAEEQRLINKKEEE